MKGNPALIIVTHLKPIVFATLQVPEIAALASWELQASELRIIGREYKNE
jgi:hypothetical protein